MLALSGMFAVWAFLLSNAGVVQRSRVPCDPRVRGVVEQFLRYDYSGYMLDSEGHEAIWKLTDEDGQPPEDSTTVTKSFRVGPLTAGRNECQVTVRYSTYGYFPHESLVFHRKSRNETWKMFVKCEADACKIELDFGKFRIPSHPGRTATLKWLKGLESMQSTQAERDSVHRVWQQIAQLK